MKILKELILIKWDQTNGIVDLKITCSAGTYIRSIARDLGTILNSEGCLLKLNRTSACGFNKGSAIKISDLKKETNYFNFIIPTIAALDHISTYLLKTEEEINFWRTGRLIKFNLKNFSQAIEFDRQSPIKVVDLKKNLLGIGFINNDQTDLLPKLVLNSK